MVKCLECGIKIDMPWPRFFVVPGHIMVPNEYYLCDKHKDKRFTFEDIYNNDGTRKKGYQKMKPIPFSGMMCNPRDISKEGDFKIKGVINVGEYNHPQIVRYEHFPCVEERDKRYNMLLNLLKEER